MIIAALIGIMIAIVVGVTLIPTIMESTTKVVEEAADKGEPLSSGLTTLLDILPIIFVAVILLGAVSWISVGGAERREKVKSIAIKLVKNPKSLIISIERASKNWDQYTNNLDELLGVKTIEVDKGFPNALTLFKSGKLEIDQSYDWYVADKNPHRDMFKVVGLHKEDSSKNKVYLLGKNDSTSTPYLIGLPDELLKATWKDCASYVAQDPGKRELVGTLT